MEIITSLLITDPKRDRNGKNSLGDSKTLWDSSEIDLRTHMRTRDSSPFKRLFL